MEEKVLFADLGLSKEILLALEKKGFKEATEIQSKVIPLLMQRENDVIGVAQTGTGKTAAFGLPILENIGERNKKPKALILAPTRELALQVCSELNSYVGKKRLKMTTVYGGASINNQIKDLNRGVDVVVGTPGRVLDLIDRRKLDLKEIDYFILDEADEMLNMGFVDDIEKILAVSNNNKSVLLFSATMPKRIKQLSKKYMKNQVIVEAKKKEQNTDLIEQKFFRVKASEKFDALKKIIESADFFYGIVFCKTKRDVETVTRDLKRAKYEANCIHGDVIQSKREKILKSFKSQRINILVATDVAARGIDVENLSHVINYSLPQELETYVHRVGRTGRAGKKGVAISLVSPAEMRMITPIERMMNKKLEKGVLPKNSEIKAKQDEKLLVEIDKIVNTKDISQFLSVADSLIEKYGEIRTITSLLFMLKGGSAVVPVRDKKERRVDSRDRKDNRKSRAIPKVGNDEVRLFVAKGKMDKMNERALIDFLEKESGVSSLRGKNVKVCDKFSFVTVSGFNAKKILSVFDKKSPRRPLVEVASN